MQVRMSNPLPMPTVLLDQTCLRARSLSWKAKGLYCFIITQPDDWKLNMADLVSASVDGRNSLRTAVKELEEAGYLQKQPAHTPEGRLRGWKYIVCGNLDPDCSETNMQQ